MLVLAAQWDLFSYTSQRYLSSCQLLLSPTKSIVFSRALRSWLKYQSQAVMRQTPYVTLLPHTTSPARRSTRKNFLLDGWRREFWRSYMDIDSSRVVLNPVNLDRTGPLSGLGLPSFEPSTAFEPTGSASRSVHWFKLQFFILMLNSGWHLTTSNFRGGVTTHQPLLGPKLGAGAGVTPFAVNALWPRWGNIFFFLLNIFFYKVPVFGFGQPGQRPLVEALNWSSWSGSHMLWRYTHLFFFFNYSCRTGNAREAFRQMKTQLQGLAIVTSVEYHYHTLSLLSLNNIPTLGLCDITVEPWLCWYPVFGCGSDRFIQYLFLLFVLRVKAMGVAAYTTSVRAIIRYSLIVRSLTCTLAAQ